MDLGKRSNYQSLKHELQNMKVRRYGTIFEFS